MERLFTLGLSNALAAAVLAIGVAALGRLFVRRPAALHCLWLLVLLKLVTPPLFEVPIVGFPAEAAKEPSAPSAVADPVPVAVPEDLGMTTEQGVAEFVVRDAPD